MALDRLTGRREEFSMASIGSKITRAAVKVGKVSVKGVKRTAGVVKRNPKMVTAAVAASGIVGYGIYQATKVEETPLTITAIEAYKGGSKTEYAISYTPPIGILQTDGVSITGSQTIPSIDGSPSEIIKILGPSSFVLDLGEPLTSMAPGGTIKITSSFLAQSGAATGEATGDVAGATAQGAAAAVAPAAAAAPAAAEGFLGLGPYAVYFGAAGALCSSLCCMLLVVFILKQSK